MKQILIVLGMIILLGSQLIGCKKTEEPTPKTEAELLIGKWQVEKNHTIDNEEFNNECENKNMLEFFPDKSMHWFSYQFINRGCSEYFYHLNNDVTYRIAGNQLSFHYIVKEGNGGGEFKGMTFEVNEQQLIIRSFSGHKGTWYKRVN